LANPEVHAEAEVSVKVGMKGAGVYQADLVAETWEINDSTDFITGGAGQSGCFRHKAMKASEGDPTSAKMIFQVDGKWASRGNGDDKYSCCDLIVELRSLAWVGLGFLCCI
jgi:hypothetical protein